MICSQTLTQKTPGLQCGFCTNFFHVKCTDLTKTQVEAIKSTEFIYWKCTTCSESADGVNKHTGCAGCTMIPSLLESINKLNEMVAELKRQVEEPRANNKEINAENIINEVMERQNRANNLIIFKLQESGKTSLASQKQDDTTRAKEIFNMLSPEINTDNIEVVRLGKISNNTSRPLKVTFSKRSDVLKMVWNKSKLRDSEYNVTIGLDETVMQRQYYKKIKAEMEERNAKGETLKIKYVNGTPTIVNAKN